MKKVNNCGCRNEMFQNGCLMWVHFYDTDVFPHREWYECFWQKPNASGSLTFGGDMDGERFIRLTGDRKCKPSKTELFKKMAKMGIRPMCFTQPAPFKYL